MVRDVKQHSIDEDQLKVLLTYVEEDIHDYNRQATAFSLLKVRVFLSHLFNVCSFYMHVVRNIGPRPHKSSKRW